LNSYLGSRVLGGIGELGKRRFIVITDKYFVIGKYPRIPNPYLYGLIIGKVLRFNEVRYGPNDMAKLMEAVDKHKEYAIPLEQISMIDVVMPKRGLWTTKKGYMVVHVVSGSQVRIDGTHYNPSDEVVQLLNQLFPGHVRVFNQ